MDKLLENQIARCSGIISRIADSLEERNVSPDACRCFAGHIPALMKACAAVGKVVMQVRASDRKTAAVT